MKNLFLILCCAACLSSCSNNRNPVPDIIPQPAHLFMQEGRFSLTDNAVIGYPKENETLKQSAEMLAEMLGKATSLSFQTVPDEDQCQIALVPQDSENGAEAYSLSITPTQIIISADRYNGVFYALQTLFQMLPPEVYSAEGARQTNYVLPCIEIFDYPQFKWRGLHLDVSRHFFPKEFIYKIIDLLAMHKMNVFHWHLTDDQGWRLQIKKYPLLTEIAAWRVNREDSTWNARPPMKPGEKPSYGGFYTQQEVKDIVAYAARRGVTIVPEIEMPGHSAEIFAAYPELSCTGKQQTVLPGGTYPPDYATSLCPGNEEVYRFLEGVLDEVLELFPSEYIHIGGDEASKKLWETCPKCQARMKKEGLKNTDELQGYLIKRIEKYLNGKGRKLIGWDEILEKNLSPETAVMSWRGMAGGIQAAQSGHDVVMSPGTHLYFDHYQNTPENEPTAIGGFSTVKKVYDFKPIPDLLEPNGSEAKHILGVQANTWTEYIATPEQAEYMIVPRISALAEVAWSPDYTRDWFLFMKRLHTVQMGRFDQMGIRYHQGADYVHFMALPDPENERFMINMESEIYGVQIRYTTDSSVPTLKSALFKGPIEIQAPTLLRAIVVKNNTILSKTPSERYVGMHKAVGKPVLYKSPFSSQYRGKGAETLNDGFTGSTDLNDIENQGIANRDLDIVYDMGEPTEFSSVKGSFLQSIGAWVYFPSSLVVEVSDDGKNFTEQGRVENPFDRNSQVARKTLEITGNFTGRYIRIKAENPITPEGLPGAGQKNWLFVDEIFVN